MEVKGTGSLWAPEESQGHGGSWWGLQRCGEAEMRTSVLESESSRSLCGPLHRSLSVCDRRSWSGTRGSLGSWSSSPTGPVTASHLLLSTLTSRSSEWDRGGVVEIVPSLSLVWPWFLHTATRGTPNLRFCISASLIHSLSPCETIHSAQVQLYRAEFWEGRRWTLHGR